MNILLTADDFADLIRGKIIKREFNGKTIQVALQDIGYDLIFEEIYKAIQEYKKGG